MSGSLIRCDNCDLILCRCVVPIDPFLQREVEPAWPAPSVGASVGLAIAAIITGLLAVGLVLASGCGRAGGAPCPIKYPAPQVAAGGGGGGGTEPCVQR